jgi:mRNA-degrading endonuclease toxin of MazEF toxin-antitoxin module
MNRGDIVLARFPHTAGTPAKNRPVLVVQGDYYNQRISNVLLASVTSNLARKSDHAHYFIDVATPEGKKSGLKQDSLVSRLNLAVLPRSDLSRKIGELSARAMQDVEECLRAALGMS